MEEQPKTVVTKITSDKPKDPKRVAQGNRLAEISKVAKERKIQERVEANTASSNTLLRYTVVASTLGADAYYAYTRFVKSTFKQQPQEPTSAATSPPQKPLRG